LPNATSSSVAQVAPAYALVGSRGNEMCWERSDQLHVIARDGDQELSLYV